jgi:F0F1-type ATP synthase assembly protein I
MAFNRPIPNPRPQPQQPRSSNGIAALVQAEKMVQVAILLPSSAFIGWLIGAWADIHLHQKWMAIAGIVLGGVSGLVYVIRMAIAAMKATRVEDKKGSRTETGNPDDKS